MKKQYIVAIVTLFIFCLLLFFLTRFSEASILATEGYFVSDDKFEKVLLSDAKSSKSGNVKLEKVTYEDTFYTNMNKLYLGNEKLTFVNRSYPIFSNSGSAIVNLDHNAKLVNDKFEFFDSYENSTLTGGRLYNYGDLEQADYETYLFLQLSNMTYVNLFEIQLKTVTGNYSIPVHSIINFQEDFIKYYCYDNSGKLIYHLIDGVDLDNSIIMGESQFSYKHLLISFGKIVDEETLVDVGTTDPENEDYIIEQDNANHSSGSTSTQENKYVKPKVSVDDFTVNVYSATSKLRISDPSAVIIGGINFQFKIGDKVFLRKTFVSSGNLEITGLVPNTEFTIVGSYKYYSEDKKKMEVTFFEQKVTTLDVEQLEPIELDFSNGPIYSNKLQIDNIHITSSLESETIKGVNKAVLYINDEAYSLSSSLVQDLIHGKVITYTTPAKLFSNQEVKFEFKLLDAFGNEIKTHHKAGVSRTSKESPSAVIKVVDSAVNSTTFGVTLKNNDQVTIQSFRYVVYNRDSVIVASDTLDSSRDYQEVTLDSLDPNSTYLVKVIGNFNIEDGNGTIQDGVMGEGKFTTMPLSSLGFLRIISNTSELTDTSSVITSSIDLDNVSSLLLELLQSLTINVYDSNQEVVYTKTYRNTDLESIKAGQPFTDTITSLSSVSEYTVEFVSYVVQGSVREKISVLSSLKSFKTHKKDATLNVKNRFVNSDMIDFDVSVVDEDGAIESGRILLEVRDSSEKLVAMESLSVNGEYQRLIYEKLVANEKYTFTYKVEEYNVGYDNSTFESDYVLFEETIVTEEGIQGSIEMVSLLRQINGKNLFNISDYNRIRTEGNTSSKEYDLDKNTVKFSAKNGYVNFSYYLPEGNQKEITISFYAKYDDKTQSTAPVYISKSYSSAGNYELTDLSKSEWKKYSFTFTMTSDYIGFLINETANMNMQTDVLFKDIMIQDLSSPNKDVTDVSLSYHPSGYKFTDAIMYTGSQYMPSWQNSSRQTFGNLGDGYARITNLKTNEVQNFSYTGAAEEFVVSEDGTYKIELWGASGGNYRTNHGGAGAYTSGNIKLTKDMRLYFYVGGHPISYSGGYNGGGTGGNSNGSYFGGGGATDVRLVNGVWNDADSLKSRIMVAAGGAGSGYYTGTNIPGGAGGGLVGELGKLASCNAVYAHILATGGTQVSGGLGVNGNTNSSSGGAGAFGYATRSNVTYGTGGGGGYYGGGSGSSTNCNVSSGAGGSSYISGYKGCVAYDQIVNLSGTSSSASDTYVEYSEKDEYLGTLNINLYDTKDEIPTDDYYIRIYLKGELQNTFSYDLVQNEAFNVLKEYEFLKNKTYTVKLSVKIRDRFYDIDTLEFNTNTEIRTIRTIAELFAMHPSGNYIVLNDLDLTNNAAIYSSGFYGSVDFQGHTLSFNVLNRSSYIFHTFASSATIKNVVLDVTLDNTSSVSYWRGLSYRNYGTMDNIMLNILSSNNLPNTNFSLLSESNYGTIQNFVVHCQEAFSAVSAAGILVWNNQGIIRNGYVYGENIQSYHENLNRSRKDVGVIAGQTSTNSRIENVYSLITVEKNSSLASEASVGNLIGYSAAGTLQNVYSSEDSNKVNTNALNHDPNIGSVAAINAKNVFYSSDNNYNSDYSIKISKLALADSEFQNKVLNSHDGFNVDSLVSLGYYPQVKMNECMPNQEWIPLPTVTDGDLVDITSSEQISSDGDSAVVVLNINNPGAEKITKIGIQDIDTVKILSQEDEWGKTRLTIELSNPIKYQSRYYVRSMTITGQLGFEYDKTYGQYERGLDIDLYYPITSLADWKLINQIPNQNYILETDLDFLGAANSYVVNNTFSGKLNGNGHTIKNVSISSANAMFNNLTGTIENLYIENYSKTNYTSYGGFIYQASSNAVIDNVHMTHVSVSANSYLGGIVGYGNNITIKNSSVTEFSNVTTANREDIRIGALAGYLINSLVQNSFAQDVDIRILDSVSTYGVGGLVGQFGSGTAENVYATGNIRCNSAYVGGIIGYGNVRILNAWSYVDIVTELDFVGGIVGRSDSTNISSTLAIGAIFSNYNGSYIHRISGSSLPSSQKNYVWELQKYYGYVVSEVSSEILLSTEQLLDVNTYYDLLSFGDQFDYSSITNGNLPKLKNYDSGIVLPNQKDYKLTEEEFEVNDIQVDSLVTSATVRIEVKNPDNVDITGVEFDYLDVNRTKIATSDGLTIIEVSVTPNRFYDNYTLTGITYSVGDGPDKTYAKVVLVPLQFYKTISKFEDWQQISKTTSENYRLVADIDFAGKSNINYNVSIGRLEGQGDGYTLKNFTLDTTSTNVALIRKITSTLKNVTFDNFNITTTASGNFVNIIKMNYADVENVHFNNITIQAPKASYVAPIGRHRGLDLRNVSIYNNNITGVSYVAGLISHSLNYDTYGVVADHCTIYGTNQYVGGIIAYKDYIQNSTNFNYTATNMNVTGKTDVGGMFGYGSANNSSISNSSVTGLVGGNYIGGMSGRAGQYYTRVVEVNDCDIVAQGNNYVGGMFGWSYDVENAYVYDTTVTQQGVNYSYTGGIVGYKNGYTHNRVGIRDSVITSLGIGTGGMFGYFSGNSSYSYIYNVEINGVDRVGGVAGYANSARLYYNIANAQVVGSGNYTGGIFGYINNVDDTNSTYSTIAHNIILANSQVTGKNYVGGYAGYVPRQLTNTFFYHTILVANVNSTMTGASIGPITGLDSNLSDAVPRFYVYEKNKINDEYVKDMEGYVSIEENNFLTATDLKTQSYYTNRSFSTSYWDFSGLSNGYYPKVKNNDGDQLDLKLPVDTVSYSFRSALALTEHELPDYTVYSSGVSTVNIEFDNIDSYSYFEVYENNKKAFEQDILKRTYTIQYNYQSDLKIVVSDGMNRKVRIYHAADLIQKVSTFDQQYVYIYGDTLKGNVSATKDKYIHVFGDKALTQDLKVFDFSQEKFISENNTFYVTLLGEAIPLYQFVLDNNQIDTYATYSIIHRKDMDILYDNQILIKDGTVEIIDSSLENKKNSVIIDEYSTNNYVTILGNDGVIYNLKTEIQFPSDFSNKNIQYMSNNLNSKSSIVIVMYETGKVIVFDYRTGRLLQEEKTTSDVSLIEYFKDNLSSQKSLINDTILESYSSSLRLKELLEEDPLVRNEAGHYVSTSDTESKGNSSSVVDFSSNYVTYYNAVTQKYDVLDVSNIIENGSKQVLAENDKIYTSVDLIQYYMQESVFEIVFRNIPVVAIFITILIGIILAMILWIRNIKLLKMYEEK